MSARATNPFWTDVEKVKGDFQNLYQREESQNPGMHLAIHVDLFKVNDELS